ncbi:MAG: helix-turn-helix transcriptional regulator [Dehalococcoidia bacterium]|nr:helix-turn-helix transcriptional regulator [Dehalococcoidia bacterium]
MDNKTIGKRLQSVRESIGFTQEQVAKYLGIKREIISYIETGARPVSTLMLRKLADLYGYKFSYFVDESAKDEGPQVFMAFRVSDLNDSDLPIIAQVEKIARNLDSLYRLLGE